MSCCPPGSLPGLEGKWDSIGTVSELPLESGDKMRVYRVGNKNSDKVVYWCHDIGGFEGGRTQAMCDTFAQVLDCEVIMADAFLGDCTDWIDIEGYLKKYPSTLAIPRYLQLLKGETRKVTMIGTCWGTMPIMMLSQKEEMAKHKIDIRGGVQFHPSTRIVINEGIDEFELTKKCVVPQMLYPAANEIDRYMPGGEIIQILNEVAPGSICYPAQKKDGQQTDHGWTVRGDVRDPVMKEFVDEAIQKAAAFIRKVTT